MTQDNKVPTWVFHPAAECVGYLAEEMMLGAALKTALISQTGTHVLLRIVGDRFRAEGKNDADVQKAIQHCAAVAPIAKKHVDDQFHSIHLHTIINMWASALGALEQTLANCMIHDAEARRRAYAVTGEKTDPKLEVQEDVAAGISSRLVQWSTGKKGGKQAQLAYVDLCERFDIPLSKQSVEGFADLEEVRCVRNCFIHRRGVIDQHSVDRAPRLQPLLGLVPRIDHDTADRYLAAVSNFIVSLSGAAIDSRYCLAK